jgi:hypothetical protein
VDRKQFIHSLGMVGLGSGLCPMLGAASAGAQQATPGPAAAAPTHTCAEKMKFAEGWATRFFAALDQTVDEATRAKLMRANGHACAANYLDHEGGQVRPAKFADFIVQLRANPSEAARAEGDVIHFQFTHNYQGKDAPEAACLCPLVETKPVGLSGTYCLCSVGYLEEIFGRKFGQPVKVTLVDSVLRGGPRCKFTIELA